MTAPDREQIRRDAERFRNRQPNMFARDVAMTLARHCLALLDALEQAEKARDEAQRWITPGKGNEPVSERDSLIAELMEAEARAEQAERERDAYKASLDAAATGIETYAEQHAQDQDRLAAVPALVEAGSKFLTAWIDASVADEEGLLAAVDQREWTAMWQRVDEAAQEFGTSVTAYQETTK